MAHAIFYYQRMENDDSAIHIRVFRVHASFESADEIKKAYWATESDTEWVFYCGAVYYVVRDGYNF